MPKGPLVPSEFTATQWSTAEEKAQFGNTLLHFIENGCKETLFTKKFYNRLMHTFGHIAHYSRDGFFAEWFTSEQDRLRFVQHLLRWPCHGDPRFTFCDVEHALQREVRARNLLGRYQVLASEEVRGIEIAALEKLEAKYRRPCAEVVSSQVRTPQPNSVAPPPAPPVSVPIQGTLF